jgi:hypothetical protein
LGEILKAMPKNKGLVGSKVTGSKREPLKDTLPTYKEIKLDKKLAAQGRAKYIVNDAFDGADAVALSRKIGGTRITARSSA